MSKEEAWRHIQDQELEGEDENEGEEDPTERQQRGRHGNTPEQTSRKRLQEATDEREGDGDDHTRPIWERRVQEAHCGTPE